MVLQNRTVDHPKMSLKKTGVFRRKPRDFHGTSPHQLDSASADSTVLGESRRAKGARPLEGAPWWAREKG